MKSLYRMFAACMLVALCASLALTQEKPGGKNAGQSKQGKEAGKKPGGQGMPMMPKPSPEIQKLIKALAGTWSVSEKTEPSEFMPQGGSGSGTDTVKAGPGGNSLVRDYRSKGPMGSFTGHSIIYWDPKRQVYGSVWCDSMSPEGCDGATGKWEGDDLVFNAEGEMMGKKIREKWAYTDIKPDSHTFYIDSSMDGGPMKRSLTITYTRKPATKAAAPPAKQ